MLKSNRISPVALGLTLGVFWGIYVLVMGLAAHFYSYGVGFVASMGVLYIGYEPSVPGSLVGGAIAFVDAFIGGIILAWLYNFFSCCCCKGKDSCKK